MREILFRGKSLYDNKWVEGFYVHANKAYGEDIDRHFIIEHGEFEYDDYDAWEVKSETVGQYTGLTDKNGKKIFEGDIVKIDGYEKGYEVKYMLGQFFVGIHMPIAYKRFDCEIIGNIHDNPELLEVANG